MSAIDWAERGYLPDYVIRLGIRRLLGQRAASGPRDLCQQREAVQAFVELLRQSPLAVETDAANSQHYEVPARFFELVLGPRLKYSCGLWPTPSTMLAESETAMLELTCQRAELADGQSILELGCGWGSLTLWMAEKYPSANIVAVSNSHGQKKFIEARAAACGLANVQIITADMRSFDTDQQFDRVVSVEMFEHMRNYQLLLQRIAGWLNDGGKLFAHIFCHREQAYLFEIEGDDNWMGRHFFTGGMMPADHLLAYFQDDLTLERQWRVDGQHYQRTSEAWLKQLDAHRNEVLQLFAADLPRDQAALQMHRWRIFFLAVAELFGYRTGQEWWVSHYRFKKITQ
jgi:cyclopropane-fatty-acyl-phospholipid synthase